MPDESVDWIATWQPMVDAVGRDFGTDRPLVWGERIDPSAVARFVEPLELDCPLHSDRRFADALGYRNILVPWTALVTLTLPLLWRPGDPPLFATDDRNGQPTRAPISAGRAGLEPPTTNSFAVQWDMEFQTPAVVGDRLCRRGELLVSCVPKQTRAGRGAFIQWQSEIVNERFERIATMRNTVFRYNLLPTATGEA